MMALRGMLKRVVSAGMSCLATVAVGWSVYKMVLEFAMPVPGLAH
jgi:hypothetical protein